MNDNQPVFIQIIELIESDIITGVYKTDDLIISTTQISKVYNVNPTTAVKAISKLTDAGILYKKRGIGMCVAEGAREKITERRKDVFINQTIGTVLTEAKTLGISTDQLIEVLRNKEQGIEEQGIKEQGIKEHGIEEQGHNEKGGRIIK